MYRSLLLLFVLICGAPVDAGRILLPRHPALSPDGSQIAFSWQGDIWTVPSMGGQALRLTAHPALDNFPIWSRDGHWLAFASTRYGNTDVFLMPTDCSDSPKRLTFASSYDLPVDFTPDSKRVLFTSRRQESVRKMPALYTVPVDGGTPTLKQSALGRWAACSPDSSSLAFVRGGTRWSRRHYRGAANRDLWLRNNNEEYVQLTDFSGDDDRPSWIGMNRIVFLSSRSGSKNVFLLDLETNDISRITSHVDADVRCPRASADGSLIAYEFEDAIWTVPSSGGAARRLEIEGPPDPIHNPVEHKVKRKGADELALSPDGSLAGLIVHGDIFVAQVLPQEDQDIAEPITVRVTATSAREKDLSWSPDGTRLLFTSDREGSDDLFTVQLCDGSEQWIDSFEFMVEQLTDSPYEEHLGRFSPDGKQIAFVRDRGDLLIMKSSGEGVRELFKHWRIPDFEWSPDGRWIVYSIPDVDYNYDVWVVEAGGGEPYNISRHPDSDSNPSWSPDGKLLVWLSQRHADTADVWGVWLVREDHEKSPEAWLKYWNENEDAKTVADENRKPKSEFPDVIINFDGLWQRARSIISLKGDEGNPLISPDGKYILFTAEHREKRDLHMIRWDGEDLTQLTTGGQEPSMLQFDEGGTSIFYLDKDGVVKRVDLGGKVGDPVPFVARYDVDLGQERAQVFEEAWREINTWFYDDEFHGVDWQAQRDKYRPWAVEASHEYDFEDIMDLMLGELNASHMGYSSKRDEGGTTTGWIGLFFDPAAEGPGLLVREVLPESPAARVGVDIKAGERILSVDGRTVTEDINIFSLLNGTVGRKVHLGVLGSDGKERRVAITSPLTRTEEARLRYKHWVSQRRQLVEDLSGGRLGYLHIYGMKMPFFEQFERDLYAAGHEKEGLIIDVRSNSGGWTTDYLMTVLSVKRHAYALPRGVEASVRAYPQLRLPFAAWTGPAVVICNEESYSNAEIFSHAFKVLKRGTLVGVPTFGAVISTRSFKLLNGASVAVPLRGWFAADTGRNLENHGAEPDLLIFQPPGEDMSADLDTQLEKAVEEFLTNLGQDPRYGAW